MPTVTLALECGIIGLRGAMTPPSASPGCCSSARQEPVSLVAPCDHR